MSREQRGTIQERPEAFNVNAGYTFVVEGEGQEPERVFVSDGQKWIEDLRHELWTLKYGEDIKQGDRIRRPHVIGGHEHLSAGFIFASPGVPITEFCEVMERREFGGCGVACILVRPDGEQIPFYCATHEIVQVAAEVPR